MEDTIEILCPKCIVCGNQSVKTVARASFINWKSGQLIQVAFPTMPLDERETLITGTHPECWTKLFGEEE